MGIALSEETLRLVDGKNYAVLATVNPDGSPQTSVVWVGRDGGDLLFSTVEGRVKYRNMLRDPRVSVSRSTRRTQRTTSSYAAGCR
jgi:PPOX class probable F420-dependent enzyme